MTALLDGRPPGVDARFRPGKTFTFDLEWPAGYLVGRAHTAELGASDLAVAVDGDTMTVTASAAQTTAAGTGAHTFVITDTTDGATEPVIVGTWEGRMDAATAGSATAEVSTSSGTVTVTVAGSRGRFVRPVVSVEEGWLDLLSQRKAAASDRLFRAVAMCDSLGAGYYASNFLTGSYPALIAQALQDELGDGGSGWIDSAWQQFFFLPAASGQVTVTGAWTGVGGGPNHSLQRPTAAGNGATITSPFRGTTLDMVQRRGSGFGSWTYSIDGASAVTVSAANATADIHTTTVTGLAPGAHTVTRTATTGDCRLAGIRGRNATGVVLDNYSRASAAYVNTAASFNLLRAAEGIAGATTLSTTLGMHDVIDLAIFGLGVNDALDAEVTAAGLEAVLYPMWDELRRKGPAGEPPLIVVVLPHLGKHDDADTSPEYPRVVSTLRSWASGVGAAVVDVWGQGRRSWDYWDGLGAWGSIGSGSDGIHLSDIGQALTARSAIDLLT